MFLYVWIVHAPPLREMHTYNVRCVFLFLSAVLSTSAHCSALQEIHHSN